LNEVKPIAAAAAFQKMMGFAAAQPILRAESGGLRLRL